MIIDNNVHARLKEVRKYLGLNQREMAVLLDVHPSYYSEVENNKRPVNGKLIETLNVKKQISSDWMYSGKGQMVITNSGYTENTMNMSLEEINYKKAKFKNDLEIENKTLFDIYGTLGIIKYLNISLSEFLPTIVIDDITKFQNGLPDKHPLSLEYKDYHSVMLKHLKLLEKHKSSILEFSDQLTNFLAKMKELDKNDKLPQFNTKFWPKK